MPTRPDDRMLVDGLVQLTFAVQNILTRIAGEYDLSLTQLRLLGILRDREPGMMQLAQHLGLDKSSVTGLIDRAEKRGLVRRAQSPGDGRAVLVAMTPPGRALAAEAERTVDHELAQLLGDLSAAEQRALASIASKVVGSSPALDR